jgi:Cu-Zn family superoxide dismutase
MIRSLRLPVSLCVAFTFLLGCDAMKKDADTEGQKLSQSGAKVAVANLKPSKAATTQPTMNNVHGSVTFTQAGDKVHVVAHIMGLTPNTTHGFHIHEKGDLSAPDLSSAGAHYNPQGHPHAGPDMPVRHAGDLGNVTSDSGGNVHKELTVDNISIGEAKNDIVGKSVIVHAKADDLKSQPSGDAGGRIAGGVIELKK